MTRNVSNLAHIQDSFTQFVGNGSTKGRITHKSVCNFKVRNPIFHRQSCSDVRHSSPPVRSLSQRKSLAFQPAVPRGRKQPSALIFPSQQPRPFRRRASYIVSAAHGRFCRSQASPALMRQSRHAIAGHTPIRDSTPKFRHATKRGRCSSLGTCRSIERLGCRLASNDDAGHWAHHLSSAMVRLIPDARGGHRAPARACPDLRGAQFIERGFSSGSRAALATTSASRPVLRHRANRQNRLS